MDTWKARDTNSERDAIIPRRDLDRSVYLHSRRHRYNRGYSRTGNTRKLSASDARCFTTAHSNRHCNRRTFLMPVSRGNFVIKSFERNHLLLLPLTGSWKAHFTPRIFSTTSWVSSQSYASSKASRCDFSRTSPSFSTLSHSSRRPTCKLRPGVST